MRYLILCILFFPHILNAQDDTIPTRTYQAYKLNDEEITIDGDLDEEGWQKVEWTGSFTQMEPDDGAAPVQDTRFKLLYDDRNIYFGFRAYDDEPHEIENRLSRRDRFPGDWIEVNIDSDNDGRTAFSFTASASGVRSDEFISGDGNDWDRSYDAIWRNETTIDSLGWTAEIMIPLTQLRFSNRDVQTWGIQVKRRHFRHESRSIWQYIPQGSGAWVSRFGDLEGIRDLESRRIFEIKPYVLAQGTAVPDIAGHPFKDGFDTDLNIGLDGKIGVTRDLTMAFTINPDFGQVESDPSVLSLDGFQIFFREQRPFFVENSNIYEFRISGLGGGPFGNDALFYSRRIGSSPHRRIFEDPDENLYVDQPNFTTILGAAKFSGKTRSGLSMGIMEAVTQQEKATILSNGDEREEVVEPLTSYFVGRLQQDLNGGRTLIGGMVTAVNRDLQDQELDFLHSSAYAGGIDFEHRWLDNKWRLGGNATLSHVTGSTEAITRTQRSFEHQFQRPGGHLKVDSTATDLTGTGGSLYFGDFKGELTWATWGIWRSPQLELNDVGFMRNTDEFHHLFGIEYEPANPVWIFRELNLGYSQRFTWDFGGNKLKRNYDFSWRAQFNNLMAARMNLGIENLDISNNALRGGPALRKPPGFGGYLWLATDDTRKFAFEVETFQARGSENTVVYQEYEMEFHWQVSKAARFSFEPSLEYFTRPFQYVNTTEFEGRPVYIGGEIDQETIRATFRLSINFSPDLSLEYYGQPFASRGRYAAFKEVIDPMARRFADRFRPFEPGQVVFNGNGIYEFDVDENDEADFSFGNPDFDILEFRSNLVLRWEYRLGSELFLVWSQSGDKRGDPQRELFNNLNEFIFEGSARSTFLLKATYRFGR